ncbi:PREDICTED: protein PLANT CADMIUM RESISTANCE 2-like [Theobroma cacao]|uniref:Protein PLANT CADMIUM RESISTANCE 2-like n=1 Tax=Theobroma cacao TaxID=3641 RepID=A0AB32VV97_THECC|nr:PREDICTED: protein PLANT CADMIUM RESISTANCE 2-like [Theobroma cacao]
MTSSGRPHNKVLWSLGFCDCLSDMKICCIACWRPCITFGRITKIVDKGSTACGASAIIYILIKVLIDCPSFYSCFYRTKMREQYMLKGGGCGDCMLHCCCEICALTQEYRELKNRGFDMSIGIWHANVEKNQGLAMAPVLEKG